MQQAYYNSHILAHSTQTYLATLCGFEERESNMKFTIHLFSSLYFVLYKSMCEQFILFTHVLYTKGANDKLILHVLNICLGKPPPFQKSDRGNTIYIVQVRNLSNGGKSAAWIKHSHPVSLDNSFSIPQVKLQWKKKHLNYWLVILYKQFKHVKNDMQNEIILQTKTITNTIYRKWKKYSFHDGKLSQYVLVIL